uniref:putative nuclease HARBI1 isoform X3 n=2 Tax=Pristiophorus japonicus TaxID=55135 RepID=UPI00398F0038
MTESDRQTVKPTRAWMEAEERKPADEHSERNRRARRRRGRRPYSQRVYREHRSYLQLSEAQCLRRLRFRKEVVTEICQLLQADLQPTSSIRTALPVEVKVTAALAFYASGSFQASAGQICSISQHAAHCCIRQVTAALYARRLDFINFPMTKKAQNERAVGFAQIAGFPKVQAAIDCTHIALRAPLEEPEVFRNRKGFHSLNVQIICDHTQHIMAVNAQYPGSIHDAFILFESSVSYLFERQPQGQGWVLGDKSYSLATWLMTPLRNPQTEAEYRYNDSHVATHNIVKKTIGILKQRFRCLDRSGGCLQYSPQQVAEFTVVCCMLHNLAIMRGQDLPLGTEGPRGEEDEEEEDEEEEDEEEEDYDEDDYDEEVDEQPGDDPMLPPPSQGKPHGAFATAKALRQQLIIQCFA